MDKPFAPRHLRYRRFRIVLTAVLAVMLYGCNMEVEDFCAKAVPEFERRLVQASSELPYRSKIVFRSSGKDRSPASAEPAVVSSTPHSSSRFTEEDRDRWRDWSQERLDELQSSLDVVSDNPELSSIRRELSSAADQAVAFYGYATAGNLEKMRETLGTLDTKINEIKQKACPQLPRQ